MDDRWAYPIPMAMQRQAGSAPKPRTVKSPPVAPSAAPRDGIAATAEADGAAPSDLADNCNG